MLAFELTDRMGTVMSRIDKHYGGSVAIPVNDARTAQVSIDLWDPACLNVIPGTRMLKAFYDGSLVFYGVITAPSWDDEEADHVVIHAIDPVLALQHRMIGIDDVAYTDGLTMDGDGMWALVELAEPDDAQITAGALKTGIVRGVDTSNPKTVLFKSQRGAVIYDEIQARQDVSGGVDWNLRPMDADNPGATATWEPGVYAEFSTYAYRGVDRRELLAFHDSWGRHNCHVGYNPDFTQCVNYAVTTASGGPTDTTDDTTSDAPDTRALTEYTAGWAEVGIMESWDSSEATASTLTHLLKILQSESDATVAAYKETPPFFTVTLTQQGELNPPEGFSADEPYRYLTHFTEGDEIRVQKKKGYCDVTLDGRIKQVTLTDDELGNTTTSLDCVPDVGESDFNES